MTIRVVRGTAALTEADVSAAEEIFARWVVRRFVREHPAMFGREQGQPDDEKLAGPDLRRCTGRAVTPREAGPARSERETSDDRTGTLER